MKHLYSALSALIVAASAIAANNSAIDLYPDTWVGIDALERVMPTADTEPLRTDKERTVGIFYVSWHYDFFHSQFRSPYGSDVTKILEQDPSARLDYNHPLWLHEFACHWGEPELGYFTSGDEYVIRKDISMLTDAGVDVLILDCTNAVCYFEAWDVLFNTLTKMKKEGNVVPKVCFWGYNGAVADRLYDIYNYYYKRNLYSDLWFYWDGKPLLLYNKHATYRQEIYDFFTLRNMWWGYYVSEGEKYVGHEDNWSFGLDMHDGHVSALTPQQRTATHKGRLEEIAVTPAQHSSTLVGKSWTLANGEPTLNQYDLPNKKFENRKWIDHPEYRGYYFQERWDEALSADPDFIYLNDWNEWIAGQFAGNVTFMRRQSNFHFVDQYNAEFNRTIQPMKGGATDNYYMQMVQNIRRYKGVREAPKATVDHRLTLQSDLSLWDAVEEEYLDTPGDVTHRNHTGYGGNVYVNTSGRNDILRSKVNVSETSACFYVETAAPLTSCKDPNWMLLLINTDCDFSTGWYGFDVIVNRQVLSSSLTKIYGWNAEAKSWDMLGTAPMRIDSNRLVIEIPIEKLGIDNPASGNFYFKWADNPADLNDPISLCIDGDTAPNRRFAYNYRWDYGTGAASEIERSGRFSVTPLNDSLLHVDSEQPFRVMSLLGVEVASGEGSATLRMPAPGVYVVNNGNSSVKVLAR